MPGPLKPIIQQDVSKGMNAVTNPYDIGAQQSISLINFVLDEHGSVRTRDGWMLQTISPDLAPDVRPIVKLFDFAQDATGGGGSGTGTGGGGGGVAPVVLMTAPTDGTVVAQGMVTLRATATPQAGLTIASVQFFLFGAPGSPPIAASPYTFDWDTSTLPPFVPFTWTAVATDSAGNVSTSAPIILFVTP